MPEVKERPILFSGPMVRAILDGDKAVTRRAVKMTDLLQACLEPQEGELKLKAAHKLCPLGRPGDRLWVREAWAADAQVDLIAPRELSLGEPILYPADGAIRQTGCAMISRGKIRPSIHMPRWISRIQLEITDVRVERLQDITKQQALAEGVMSAERDIDRDGNDYSPVELFGGLWVMINGMGSWNANPWVWVIEFKRVTP
ncbi:hypothetical protein [Pseudomonas asplenii]|uniref:Phage-related protein n=1 Tax=Pseudomonas asplenii TaxID=53407 RepID=A0A1H6P0D6_9PSED|nr:hypothetical protein [Pseudomonas fuscovaginae]SEI16987.1 hypothetical protein SAMN05216581_3279 [Pseudomonas fuscovaginae]